VWSKQRSILVDLPDKYGRAFSLSSATTIIENMLWDKNIKEQAIFSGARVWRRREIGRFKRYHCGCEVEWYAFCVGCSKLESYQVPHW
jgi:hypothetical protein